MMARKQARTTYNRIVRSVMYLLVPMLFLTGRATAQNTTTGPVDCDPPTGLTPLFELLNTLAELAFLAGIGLGLLGFLIAALFFMIPGEEYNRRGKQIAKNVLIGTILLLSANMIVSFLVSQLGGAVC